MTPCGLLWIYLAVSAAAYANFLSGAAVRYVLQRLRIALIVVDVPKQEVVTWIS